MRFYIKKTIEARSIAEAIKNERKAVITDVWRDEGRPQQNLEPAIGFAVDHREEDY